MKVLVTGADGMLGSNIVRRLLKEGYQVAAFLLPSSHASTLKGLDIEWRFGCVLNQKSIDAAISDCDYVIHAAAMTDVWPERNEKVRRVNLEGTQNIVKSCEKHRIKRMVFVGSAAATPTEGKFRYVGQKYGLDYIDSKYQALCIVQDAVMNNQLDAVTVMPTFMIGPYDSLPSSGKLIMAQALGKLKFCPPGGKNFVSAEDVAVAIVNSINIGVKGRIYIAGNENLSYQEFLQISAEVTGKKAPFAKIPAFVSTMIGMLGTLYGKLTSRRPLLSYTMARISCELEFFNTDDDSKALKMPRTSIKNAISRSYQWLHDSGYC
jgi:dihydroflavonol-4-reductase